MYNLTYLSTLEEDHVSSKDLGDWVSVEGRLRERSGNVITILVAVLKHLSPFWVLSGHGLGKVDLVPALSGVVLHVDLEVAVEQLHLLEDTGEVTHHAGNISLEVLKVHQELLEVLLGWLKKSLDLPLVSAVPKLVPGAKVHI